MEKDFQICFVLGTSVASVRSSAAPLCKGDTGGLRRGRGDRRRLSAIVCGRLAGAPGGPRPLGCRVDKAWTVGGGTCEGSDTSTDGLLTAVADG